MSSDLNPTRVRFHDRQFLQAQDLRDEQDYHMQMRRRHNLALHSWGVVAGLQLLIDGTGSRASLRVVQGMAIDGYGREVVLAYARQEPMEKLDVSAAYEVWIEYARRMPDAPPGQANPSRSCAVPDQAAGRWVEEPTVQLRNRTERRSPDVSRPDEVPPGDLDFRPSQSPPDDAAQRWPVFLGRVSFRDGNWVVDSAERRYAGLVAERIESRRSSADPADRPGGRTVVLTGSAASDPAYRFAVQTVDQDGKAGVPWLAVREDTLGSSQIDVRADRVAVAADLVLENGAAIEFKANLLATPDSTGTPPPPQEQALSGSEYWRMYHHFGLEEGGFSDELRITMPATPGGTNRVEVGCFADGAFVPILVIKDDRSVEVYGTLTVFGGITPQPIDVPAPISVVTPNPPTKAEQVEAWLNGGQLTVADLVSKLDATGKWGELATEIASHDESKYSRPIVTELWKGVKTTGRKEMGAAAGSVNGETEESRFTEFSRFLDALPRGGSDPKFVEFMGRWVFQATAPSRAASLASTLPETADNDALKAFAKALTNEQVTALLKALDTAKMAKSLLDETAKLAELVKALIGTDAGPLATALQAHSSELANPLAVLCKQSTVLTALGQSLPTDFSGLTPLVSSLLTDGTRATNFAINLFDFSSAAIPDAGKKAIAAALKDGLPGLPITLANTTLTKLRVFLKYVKAEDANLTPLKDAVKILGSLIDDGTF